MKKVILLMLFALISGCAYITEDVSLDLDSGEWSMKEHRTQRSLYYACSEDQSVSLFYNNNLSRDGHVYFIFFIVPIHSAELFDREYTGLEISSKYSGGESSCTTKDMSVTIGTETVWPSTAEPSKTVISGCSYKWKFPINDSGEFTLKLSELNNCKAPPLQFKYKKESNYNYDSLGA